MSGQSVRGNSERIRKTALLGLLLAVALVLGWVEHMLPPLTAVPGIKLGLANIPVLYALYACGRGEAAVLGAAKVVLSCALFGGFSAFLYSAAGMAASLAAMLMIYRLKSVSPVGTSAAGGFAHVAAQTVVAMALTATPSLWRVLPVLTAAGTLSGVVTGIVAALLLRRADSLKKY